MRKKWTYIEHASRNLSPSNLEHVLEFGVFKGHTLRIIKKELSNKHINYKIFGFDSFVGLPEPWITPDGNTLLKKGSLTTNNKIPDIPGVQWYVGWFKDTLPEYLKVAKDIALLHLDCDLYKPAKEVLYGLNNFIVKGTIIAIDDWFYEGNPKYNDTTQKAFYEWTNEFKRQFKFCDFPGSDTTIYGQKIVEILL